MRWIRKQRVNIGESVNGEQVFQAIIDKIADTETIQDPISDQGETPDVSKYKSRTYIYFT